MDDIPYGFCHCGCGEKTQLNKGNDKHHGLVKGEPKKYIQHHCHVGRKSDLLEDKYSPEPMSGCWLWVAGLSDTGYGTIWDAGSKRTDNAHRYVYKIHKGNIPDGMELDHLCRTRSCVNPWHMEIVTALENVRRGIKTVLSLDQVKEIHLLNKRGLGYRKLATLFAVHRSTICHLITGRNWKDAA